MNIANVILVFLSIIGQSSCISSENDNWEKAVLNGLGESFKTLPCECSTEFQSYQEMWQEEIKKIPMAQQISKIKAHVQLEDAHLVAITHRFRAGYDMENILGTMYFIQKDYGLEGGVLTDEDLKKVENAQCYFNAIKGLVSGCDFSLTIISFYDQNLNFKMCKVIPHADLSSLDDKFEKCSSRK